MVRLNAEAWTSRMIHGRTLWDLVSAERIAIEDVGSTRASRSIRPPQ
ncbi:hypothetical protein [Methylobacterium radiodurans]|nr:hypothetical protein [Methylobacterium radiodurans]